MPKHYYLLPLVDFTITVETKGMLPAITGVPLSWHDGQVGAVAAFTNKRKAQRVAKRLGIEEPLLITTEARIIKGKGK